MARQSTPFTTVQYYPNGYPQLGITSRTLPLHYRRDANLKTLRARLERWERRQGNNGFQARNLEKLPTALAFELVHVYVALRERYPDVQPDYINFFVDQGDDLLATAGSYHEYYPTLRRIANDYDLEEIPFDMDVLRDSTEDGIADWELHTVRKELGLAEQDKVGNVFSTGVIEFGDVFAKPRKYAQLLKYWERRNNHAVANGRPVRVPPLAVSAATFVFVHEFGHLVEAELMQKPYKEFAQVYAGLSEALLGQRPNARQWRYHLANYPAYSFTTVKGTHMGSRERQRDTRRSLRLVVAEILGTYAPTTREEMFAEAFSLSLVSGKASVRRQLSPLQNELTAVGLKVRRLPNRSRVA